MEIIFSGGFSPKIWTCFLFFIIYFNQEIFAERGGFLHFRFICFRNPGHYALNGETCDFAPSKNCDLSFHICISAYPIPEIFYQQHCSIYFKETPEYSNEEKVCNLPYDNRETLSQTIIKELPYPIQRIFYVRIYVRDEDFGKPANVGSFLYSFAQIPSPNYSFPTFVPIYMPRSEGRYANSKASMKIEMALQCDKDRYGEFCIDFCKSANYDNYICSSDGKKICKEGWKGENCDKADLCLFVSCAPGAECLERNGQAKCLCNGVYGSQCYRNYDPCAENPCQNHGNCIHNRINETGPRCQCNFPFYGSNCESKIDMCLVEPCHNKAKCVQENNVRRCICLEGFSGKLCDQTFIDFNQTNINRTGQPQEFKNSTPKAVTMLSILFGISLILLVVILTIHFLKKRNKKKYKFRSNEEMQVKMSDLDNKLNPLVISNQYDEKTKVDSVYDLVDDRNTYAYFKENNDDYLVPSNPETPGFIDSHTVSSNVYLEMSDNQDVCDEQTNKEVNRDSLYLPPLPTRNIKRKMSLKTFCIP